MTVTLENVTLPTNSSAYHEGEHMTETMEQLKVQLERLPSQERAELAHFLLCSLEQEADAEADAAWEVELARRVADIQSGKVVGTPAAQVFAELRAQFL
jgi:putative addiction module component (TIGR02574 family)